MARSPIIHISDDFITDDLIATMTNIGSQTVSINYDPSKKVTFSVVLVYNIY